MSKVLQVGIRDRVHEAQTAERAEQVCLHQRCLFHADRPFGTRLGGGEADFQLHRPGARVSVNRGDLAIRLRVREQRAEVLTADIFEPVIAPVPARFGGGDAVAPVDAGQVEGLGGGIAIRIRELGPQPEGEATQGPQLIRLTERILVVDVLHREIHDAGFEGITILDTVLVDIRIIAVETRGTRSGRCRKNPDRDRSDTRPTRNSH